MLSGRVGLIRPYDDDRHDDRHVPKMRPQRQHWLQGRFDLH
jgi:hypothetical protein